jgi:glycosyltransferase involved in cell wall biosynthesis
LLRVLDPSGEIVREHGPSSFSSLESFYHRADAFVFASSCENLPNILIEAMASGLPIACSDRGPMPEVLGKGGVYFDPEDPEATADALGRLLSDPDLRMRCARTAYHRAQRYSWDECARSTFCFFEQVLAGRGRIHSEAVAVTGRQTQSRIS